MSKFAKAAAVLWSALFAASVFAQAEVKGKVETDVKVGAAIQNATGIANQQEMNVGSVKGKAKIGGDFKSNVQAGALIQNATGIANKQEMNLGTVKGE